MTRLVVVFLPNTCSYCVHAESCSAATHNPQGRAAAYRMRVEQTFATVEEAHDWCDRDEWDKGDQDKPVKGSAKFRVCKCARK